MWVKDEGQQEVCRLMSEWRDQGWLLREIVAELDARGHRTARGKRWHTRSVLGAIHNYKHPPGTSPSLVKLYAQTPDRRVRPRKKPQLTLF